MEESRRSVTTWKGFRHVNELHININGFRCLSPRNYLDLPNITQMGYRQPFSYIEHLCMTSSNRKPSILLLMVICEFLSQQSFIWSDALQLSFCLCSKKEKFKKQYHFSFVNFLHIIPLPSKKRCERND